MRLQLATLLSASGDREGAALELTRVLALWPSNVDAAQRLGTILSNGRLHDDATLDARGLAACLAHRTVDRDLVGAAALHVLSCRGSLRHALGMARDLGFDAAARAIVAKRSSSLFRDELLLAVLEQCTVTNREVELLLTALRRAILLSLPPERLLEPDLARFAAALAAQCWTNEYVFYETKEERSSLAAAPPVYDRLLAGDTAAGALHLRRALYGTPLADLPADLDPDAVAAVVPPPFAKFLETLIRETADIREARRDIRHLAPVEDETTLKVKA